MVAVLFDAKTGHRLAGSRDAFDNLLRPAVFDANDNDGGYVRVGTGTDQGTKMQLEVFAELKPAVGVGQRHGAGNIISDCFAGRVRQIVDRQDNNVITHTDTTVFAPIT